MLRTSEKEGSQNWGRNQRQAERSRLFCLARKGTVRKLPKLGHSIFKIPNNSAIALASIEASGP